jgi:uncharacterized surface protein with fasciclin (FAS1) repeats
MRYTEKAKIGAVAAAIALALGTTVTLAQERGAAEQHGVEHPPVPGQTQPQAGQPELQLPEQQSGQVQQQPGHAAPSHGAEGLDQLSAEHANLSTFVKAVKAAGLADALTEGTAYTVFAPTDEAWESKDGKNVDELMQSENREELVDLLRAHIVADDVDMELAAAIDTAQTIDGGTVDIQSENGELMVGDAKAADTSGIEIDNLRIYPIDGVLANNAPQTSAFDEASREDSVLDRTQGRPSDSADIETPDVVPDVDRPDIGAQDLPEDPITGVEPQ